jgi:hypothetical protein
MNSTQGLELTRHGRKFLSAAHNDRHPWQPVTYDPGRDLSPIDCLTLQFNHDFPSDSELAHILVAIHRTRINAFDLACVSFESTSNEIDENEWQCENRKNKVRTWRETPNDSTEV